jgi:Cu+-exporting ATPase
MNHGQSGAPVTDPVCGMQIDPSSAAARMDFRGQTVHFCSSACEAKFKAAPEKYLPPKAGSK